MTASSRWFMTSLAFCLASVINPGYFAGCASETHGVEFSFGEPEVLDLLDEANATSPFEVNQGSLQYRLELTLTQQSGDDSDDTIARGLPAFAARAFACGNRSFMSSASACVTSTAVPLRARFTLYRVGSDGAAPVIEDRELAGELRVLGTRLTNGHVQLSDEGDDTRVELNSQDGRHFKLVHFHTQLDGALTVF